MPLSETSVPLNYFPSSSGSIESSGGGSAGVNSVMITNMADPNNVPHGSNSYQRLRMHNEEAEEVELPVEFFTEHPSLLEAINENLQGAPVNVDRQNSMSSGGTAQSVQMSSGSILSENVNYSVPIQFPNSSSQIRPIENEGLSKEVEIVY